MLSSDPLLRPRDALAVVLAFLAVAAEVAVVCGASGCGERSAARTLTIGAYTTPREVYAELLPQFAKAWKDKTGESLKIEQSYLGSGAQARAIAAGFEADVAALSLAPDVDVLAKAGIVHGEARVVSRSLVVIGVRPGNPKHIASFADLARSDVDVLTPDPKMSGGAKWNVAAIVGASPENLAPILKRVRVFDKGARESMLTFESGVGDAIITYENEITEAQRAGKAIDEVIPPSTLVIENPAVIVDTYAHKHNNDALAAAFLEFVTSADAQRVFAAHGYRAVNDPRTTPTASSPNASPLASSPASRNASSPNASSPNASPLASSPASPNASSPNASSPLASSPLASSPASPNASSSPNASPLASPNASPPNASALASPNASSPPNASSIASSIASPNASPIASSIASSLASPNASSPSSPSASSASSLASPNASPSASSSPASTTARTFTVADIGGWAALERDVFAPGAQYDRALDDAGTSTLAPAASGPRARRPSAAEGQARR